MLLRGGLIYLGTCAKMWGRLSGNGWFTPWFFVYAVTFSNVHHLLMSECNFICSFTILPSVTWSHDLLEFFTDSLDLTALKGVVSSALIISVLYCPAKYLLLLSHLRMCCTAKYLLLAPLFHCQNHPIISTLFSPSFLLINLRKDILKGNSIFWGSALLTVGRGCRQVSSILCFVNFWVCFLHRANQQRRML